MNFLNRTIVLILFFALPAFAGSPVQGIHNFRQVNDHVYRGGQPTRAGFKYLAEIGVKTVLDLREEDSRSLAEREAVTALGMQFVNVPMTGLTPPTPAQITKVLSLLEETNGGPVYVHCRRGADRTGAVIAAYRIDHDHWDNVRALKEAMSDGMSFFQWPRQNFIRYFQPPTIAAATVAKSDSAESKTPAAAPQPRVNPAAAVAAPAVN